VSAVGTGKAARERSLSPYAILAAIPVAALAFLILFPMGRMLLGTLVDDGQLVLGKAARVFVQPWLPTVLFNTGVVVGVSTVIAVALGAILAWLNERTDANLGTLGLVLPIIPLLIPNVALAIGWVFLAAPTVGFLNGALRAIGLPEVTIYSWTGLILVFSINGVPYVYLVVSAALRNLDPSLEEASRVSGAGLLRTLLRVSLPAIRPALIGSALLVVIMGLGVYSIPAIIATTARIDMLTTRIVTMLTRDYPPNFPEAQMLGLLMLAIIAVLWLVQGRIATSGQFVTVGGRASGSSRLELGGWRWPARLLMMAFMAAASLIPLAALVFVALQPFWTADIDLSKLTFFHFDQALFVNRTAARAFRNSLTLSTLGATIAMAVAVIAAIQLAFQRNALTRAIDLMIMAPAAIPNLVIAVAFLVALSGAPFFLAGTATILLLALIVMYIPPGSIAANTAVTQVGRDLREASYISGAGEGRTIGRIVVPLALPGFVAGWAIVFVHMMGDLSAAALLAGLRNPLIGSVILEIWETGSVGIIAAFSTLMCLANLIVVGAAVTLMNLRSKH
jgi:iron(III) transport system permease protein